MVHDRQHYTTFKFRCSVAIMPIGFPVFGEFWKSRNAPPGLVRFVVSVDHTDIEVVCEDLRSISKMTIANFLRQYEPVTSPEDVRQQSRLKLLQNAYDKGTITKTEFRERLQLRQATQAPIKTIWERLLEE